MLTYICIVNIINIPPTLAHSDLFGVLTIIFQFKFKTLHKVSLNKGIENCACHTLFCSIGYHGNLGNNKIVYNTIIFFIYIFLSIWVLKHTITM